MAGVRHTIFWRFYILSLIQIVSSAKYCNVAYECYQTCTQRFSSQATCNGWWFFTSTCIKYKLRTYPCKTVCYKEGCCNGYTGDNCNTPTPCGNAQSLPDLARRARNYVAKGDIDNDPYIDDSYLGPGWFNVGNYRMPDSNTRPELKHCGTRKPIYIKGTHPNTNNLTTDDSPLSLIACELSSDDESLNEFIVELRQCGNDTQYYLSHTSSQSGFCVDPPDLSNMTEFDKAPTDVTLGTLEVTPMLKFELKKGAKVPYLEFGCVESPFVNRSAKHNLLYSTYWFVDSVLLKAFERQNGFMSINESLLIDKGYKLNITIQCGIRVSRSVTGYQTEMQSSKSFFAGVEVDPVVINMAKDETASITLRPTVPLGCVSYVGEKDPDKCVTSINMDYPEATDEYCDVGVTDTGSKITLRLAKDKQARCGVEVKGFFPNQVQTSSKLHIEPLTMQITSPYLSDSDATAYRISLKTKNGGSHEIWKNAFLTDVQVNILSNSKYKNKMCYAHVDPHMKTADGKSYENNDYGGSFILYEHASGIQVQMRTTACNNNQAFCACAVAIRAGGDVFLINVCGGLRFIDMTSCKDGGVLIVTKYSEVMYQVQTNIGTLIKINILTGRYRNLMNIDIYMAPNDYNRTRGLCGTFDGSTGNDFHDRNGTTVSRKVFLKAWQITDSDTYLLNPSCNVEVNTWAEQGELLYCICNCHSETDGCGAPEKTATCSTSQYVNCSVSLTRTNELCQDYDNRCNQQAITRRSAFYTKPEEEMIRRAKLADLPHKFVVKRQTEDTNVISEDIARTACINKIETEIVEKNAHLLNGFNISQAIKECTWDVYTGQDFGWIDTHKQATDSAIETGYKRDANYTMSNFDDLIEFKTHTCPYNCSGNGICLGNGTCTCYGEHFGPDCATNKSVGPDIEDIEGGGFCDQRYGSECRCFSVQTEALTESFHCKRVRTKKMFGGASVVIGSESIEGRFRNLFNGECCFDEGRRKRSSDNDTDVFHYLYDISISNDGVNFGPATIVYVFDSLCLNTDYDEDENVFFTLKANICLIDGSCYEADSAHLSNICFKCDPSNTAYNWTDGCVSSADKEEGGIGVPIIATITVGAFVVFVAVVVLLLVCIKKGNNNKRSINASQEFSSGAIVSRGPSRMAFNVENLTYGETF